MDDITVYSRKFIDNFHKCKREERAEFRARMKSKRTITRKDHEEMRKRLKTYTFSSHPGTSVMLRIFMSLRALFQFKQIKNKE